MGFTLQSFSPSQSRTPFDAMTLMPFLTSHSSALRTRRSRCPAASGLFSLRGSVSSRARRTGGPMLSWDCDASPEPFPAFRRTGFPAPSFLCFKRLLSGRSDARHSKALPRTRERQTFAGFPTLLRFPTEDLPSGSPDDSGVLSDGSERNWSTPCGVDRLRRTDPPSEEGTRAGSEEPSRRLSHPEGPGDLTPRGASLLHHLVKENLQRVGPFGASFRDLSLAHRGKV